MRAPSSTVSIKLRTLQAFKNQVGYVRQHGFGQRSRQVETACVDLEASIESLQRTFDELFRLEQANPQGDTVQSWRRALRNRSLRALASTANAHLGLKLKVPHKEASNAEYIRAGEHFLQTLRPHADALIRHGMDADCLEILKKSTAKLKHWATKQSKETRRLAELRKTAKPALKRARDLAAVLHGRMLALCEDDRSILGPWNEARRIPGRVGPKRERGGHLKADARRPKVRRSGSGRPVDWDEPLPPDGHAEPKPVPHDD